MANAVISPTSGAGTRRPLASGARPSSCFRSSRVHGASIASLSSASRDSTCSKLCALWRPWRQSGREKRKCILRRSMGICSSSFTTCSAAPCTEASKDRGSDSASPQRHICARIRPTSSSAWGSPLTAKSARRRTPARTAQTAAMPTATAQRMAAIRMPTDAAIKAPAMPPTRSTSAHSTELPLRRAQATIQRQAAAQSARKVISIPEAAASTAKDSKSCLPLEFSSTKRTSRRAS
mmetsp:Transcript_14049/g.35562  ORF Transcript_14049/g.35562 Transcript_14049/m.35562 type:complete len:236 (-) Transcript_14049:741-1448(-)